MVNLNTQLCISIAARPGNIGTQIHNSCYKDLGLNFIYKAFKVKDLNGAIKGVRSLGIKGCSVSMPFKEKVLDYLDNLDETALNVGAVNTVVNNEGKLTGYNTDVYGVDWALNEIKCNTNEKILILRAGGMSKAICYILKKNKFKNIFISNRTLSNLKQFDFNSIPWEERNEFKANILINATSVGMYPYTNECPIAYDSIKNYRAIIDVVAIPPQTVLVKQSKKLGIQVVDGRSITAYQAAKQFELYTGHKPDMNKIIQILNKE